MTSEPRDANATIRAGIDIGGTFTDILVYDNSTGEFTVGKTLTTTDDPSRGATDGIRETIGETGNSIAALAQIVHGTTLITNALIERKGAKTALITTKGFRDALEIAREHRYDIYDLLLELPDPLVPRHLRFEVDERVLSDGSIDTPLDSASVAEVIAQLENAAVESVAISLLHSYTNPEHEQQIERLVHEALPDLVLSSSSSVDPEIREFERTSTTVANVYVRPIAKQYLERFLERLDDEDFSGNLLIMLSSGGVCTPQTAQEVPIRLVESGPAAGALAAAHIGSRSGRPSLFSFDMGGTTAKACLIRDGKPTQSSEFEVSRIYRFKKGSGLPVSVPVIEMIEIGAGGGSIARIDNLGLLKVGPDSAGANPGPACYGLDGSLPTVTDADLVLGYLDPDHFLGGKMKLDVAAARNAIKPVANELGTTIEQTAFGIHQIVNEQMAGAARIHAVEQGEDARLYPLFAFGGAGPVHAYRVAEILRSPELLIPFAAGVASTIGFLVAPIAFDFVRTQIGSISSIDTDLVNGILGEMESEGRTTLTEAGVADEDISVERRADMRYVGQGHEISVELEGGPLDDDHEFALRSAFETAYRKIYGRIAEGNDVESVNWRVVTSAPRPSVELRRQTSAPRNASDANPTKGSREIFLPEHGDYVQTPVLDRYLLSPGFRIQGPVVIEERESTTVVGPAADIAIDDQKNIVVTMPE